jgi:hypothetical protein
VHVHSAAETLSIENGVIQIAFDLTGSEAGYLVLSFPEVGAGAEGEFFDQTHYVEVKDQLFGHYGGLRRIELVGEKRLEVCLTNAVPLVDMVLIIDTRTPIAEPMLSYLRKLVHN